MRITFLAWLHYLHAGYWNTFGNLGLMTVLILHWVLAWVALVLHWILAWVALVLSWVLAWVALVLSWVLAWVLSTLHPITMCLVLVRSRISFIIIGLHFS